ncbi:glucose-6-phosphate dehydrogenase [Amnibacterium endophyticum]|uniref:Glucose-6-phosphate dehydrogenase n=1 Tax=Amnibacterium endophyticum TaxID=2109337 RepID=A0ABW4LJ36_9MICO
MTATTTMLILGASGDLTRRLLLPGIGSLIAGGEDSDLELLQGLKLIGSGRSEHSDDEWRQEVRDAFGDADASGDLADALVGDAEYVVGDPTSKDDFARLLEHVEGDLVVYFALPPSVVVKVAAVLQAIDLPEHTVLALEKPFGDDAEGAAHLNDELAKVVPEDRIHRVDHFLAHRAALAMLAMRFNNRLLERSWSAEDVERVEIVYDEQLGLEGRAGYYDGAGALKDMLQSHLLQVLAVSTAEEPLAFDAEHLRDALATALQATRVWPHGPVFPGTDRPSRRARYTAGEVDGKRLPSYADEDGVDPDRGTETLAEIALEVATPRWAGVPFVLRSGKAIGSPRNEIAAEFRPVRTRPEGQRGSGQPERLVLGFKPPRVEMRFTSGGGDMPFELEPVEVTGALPRSGVTEYGEVLRGILGDDPTLSIRGDVAVRCWEIVQPVLDAWASGDVPLEEYQAGSDGPAGWSAR